MDKIGETVNELRAKHDYLFTTGGIGPTHAAQAAAPELLALRDVDAFYGKSHIVRRASLTVHEHVRGRSE